ncbi:MAG: ACP S-malonyltransferase [Raoultibacter sp.]|jgi:[acyl-carrier-protein] S-malonyltransferase
MAEAQHNATLEIDSHKPVFMFSGQGSQKVGMGKSLFDRPSVVEIMTCASDIFECDVVGLMSNGPVETLNDTRYAQAVLVSLSLALASEVTKEKIEPCALLGFSLGQVCAAYASGMLSLEDTFKFAKIRSELMAQAAQSNNGKMCALLGADEAQAMELCKEHAHDEVLVIANYNCPGQIVISGHEAAVLRAQDAWNAQKKKSAMLATSGAFHSPLMQDAAKELTAYLETQIFEEPRIPLISNLDAKEMTASTARQQFADHLTHPVRFQQSLEMLDAAGAQTFVELGFGGVLVGLVKRINRKSERIVVEDKETLEAFFALNKSEGNNA